MASGDLRKNFFCKLIFLVVTILVAVWSPACLILTIHLRVQSPPFMLLLFCNQVNTSTMALTYPLNLDDPDLITTRPV